MQLKYFFFISVVVCSKLSVSLFRNQAKPLDAKEEAARAAAKAEKEKKDAMANIDINNYASLYSVMLFR